MKKNRLIFIGRRRLKKWAFSVGKEDTTIDAESPEMETGNRNIYMGAGFSPKKDPEHLPPTNFWQHIGTIIHKVPHFLASTESEFGLRAACATMTVAVICYLRDTQTFFLDNRLLWALIIISIG